ncbi:MAG: hypothetical protein AAF847_05300 [Bacteroidota bacterium]
MTVTDSPELKPSEAEELAELAAMGFQFKDKPFGSTAYADSPAIEKLNFVPFDNLNEQINLEDFGERITKIVFAFIAFDPKFFPQDQHIQYYPNQKRVSISLELNYETFIAATPEIAIQMMKDLYLKGLRALSLFNIRDFDMEGLIAAVEQAFEEKDEQIVEEATM